MSQILFVDFPNQMCDIGALNGECHESAREFRRDDFRETSARLTELFAHRTGRMRASEIRELLKLLDQPNIISFAGGILTRPISRAKPLPRR